MNAQTVVALFASLLAAVVAVTIPTWTFRRTIQHDRQKWIRDQRAQLYVDMLTEAYAEKQWFLGEMTKAEIALISLEDGDREWSEPVDDGPQLPDVRLTPMDRAKLGARGSIFASKAVSVAFNELQGHMARLTVLLPKSSGEAHMAKFKADELFEKLQDAVIQEMGAAELQLPNR